MDPLAHISFRERTDRALPRVLVVGDGADVTGVLCQSLGREPVVCMAVVGPGEACAAVRRHDFDAALVAVPRESAQDALGLVKRLRDEAGDIGLVLVADSRSLDDLAKAMQLGVVDYLARPLSDSEIVDAVGRAIEWRAAIRTARPTDAWRRNERTYRADQLAAILGGWQINSSLALDECLAVLYGRDPHALAHVRRVASAALMIATAMKIGEPLLGEIWRAGLLHDIGKLSIPAGIMAKAEPLSRDEQDVMRSQVEIAEAALRQIPFLAPAAEIVGAMREHFDGSGAPRGLGGDAIPLAARIVAVAEAFDTLTGAYVGPYAGGVYTSGGDPSAANGELVRGAGKRFDPDVVNAWLLALDQAERDAGTNAADWRMRCS